MALIVAASWGSVCIKGTLFSLFVTHSTLPRASLVAQLVKNLPAKRETWVQFLGWEDPLEKSKATHSGILAWRIPWTVHGVAKSWTRLSDFHVRLSSFIHFTNYQQ